MGDSHSQMWKGEDYSLYAHVNPFNKSCHFKPFKAFKSFKHLLLGGHVLGHPGEFSCAIDGETAVPIR